MDQQPRLIGLSGEYGGNSFSITGEKTLIGRGEDCDLQIVDSRISRNHAQLRLEDGAWLIEDLGSTHGTFVKGERIEQAVLVHGDTITIGETILRFEDPSSPDAIPTEMATPDDVSTVLDKTDADITEIDSPDDIGTVLETAGGEPGQVGLADEVATVMASPDDVPTRLVSPDDQATVASHEPVAASVDQVKPPPVDPPPSVPTRKERPIPWKWVAIAGGAIVALLIIGFGLALLGRFVAEREPDPAADSRSTDSAVALTVEALAEESRATPLIPPTLTPTSQADAERQSATETPGSAVEPTADTGSVAVTSPSVAFGGAAQLAFASDRTGRPQIFLIDLDSLEERQLTDFQGGACQPSWSADGSRLAYTSPCNVNREEYAGSSIFLMEVDLTGNPGGEMQLIATVGGGDYDPGWSRDGSRIAFTSWQTGRPQIFTVNPDGTELRNLNDVLAYNWAPTWSGDGSQLAFLTGRGGQEEIWTVPAGGGEEHRFSRSDGKDVARPDWSPDGTTIVFEKMVGNIPRLIAAPVADGGVRELQVCQDGQLSLQPMGEPTWSPDGAWLAFETWPDGVNHEIAVMRSNCTEYQLLTEASSLEFDAAWRPVP